MEKRTKARLTLHWHRFALKFIIFYIVPKYNREPQCCTVFDTTLGKYFKLPWQYNVIFMTTLLTISGMTIMINLFGANSTTTITEALQTNTQHENVATVIITTLNCSRLFAMAIVMTIVTTIRTP